MQVDALLTRNMRTPTRAGGISKRTRGRRRRYSTVFVSRRVLFLASNPEFYLQRFRLQVVLNMNTHSNPRRALKSAQERRSKDRRRRRNERDRARRAAETAEQRSERLRKRWERDRTRRAAQTAREEGLPHSREVPVNAKDSFAFTGTEWQLKPPRREKEDYSR